MTEREVEADIFSWLAVLIEMEKFDIQRFGERPQEIARHRIRELVLRYGELVDQRNR